MTQLTKKTSTELSNIYGFEASKIELIRTQICKDLNDQQLELFLATAQRRGLDPITKQIVAFVSGGKLSIITTVDALRLIAERTGKYDGQTPPEWADNQGVWHDCWIYDAAPAAARIGVYKKGAKHPTYAVARFKSYQQNKQIWKTMPDVMLLKCAEALALRKAFPEEMGQLHTADEIADTPADVVELMDSVADPEASTVGRVNKISQEQINALGQIINEITEVRQEPNYDWVKPILAKATGTTVRANILVDDYQAAVEALEAYRPEVTDTEIVEATLVDVPAADGVVDAPSLYDVD